MKRVGLLFTILAGSVGCSTLTPTENGVLGGGAVGGVTGAVVGHALGNTAAGAVIGTGVGAVAGGLTGNAIEQSENRQAVAVAAQQQAARQLGMTEVVQLSQARTSDAVIISQIRATGSVYQLSPTDIQWLKDNGVSDPVVIEMQLTASRRPVVYGRAPRPVYVVEEPYYYGPPAVVGVGFGYRPYRRW
ncbi:MAG: glycine zipper domain-containing protein [Gemmataceae bacterium]